MTPKRFGSLLASVAVLALCQVSVVEVAAASNWVMPLHSGSSAMAESQDRPPAPTGVKATCLWPSYGSNIAVSWNGVTHATTYSVYQSTTSASSGYSLVATSTTTFWVSGSLANASYWYEVTASIGSNWVSGYSGATSQATVHSSSPYCTQP